VSYRVLMTREAEQDLQRLFEFTLQRELDSDTGNLDLAEHALQAIRDGLSTLASSPFTCRKAADGPFLRELIIPFGHAGYVALFEILEPGTVLVAAVRHQREDDYH
jgi:plasmid stabilization system protein ParE